MRALSPRRTREVPPDIARRLLEASDQFGASFDTLRMDDLAKSSGIPRATLYYHFSGKDDVLAFLHEAMLAEHQEAVWADDEGSAPERLTGLLARHFAHIVRHPGAAQLLVVHLGRLRGLPELAASYDPLVEPIAEILRGGVERGEIGAIDVDRVAVVISNCAHVGAIRAVVSGEHADPQETAAWLVGLLWDGVAGSGRP